MKFRDTQFCLAARKRAENLKILWRIFETLAFDWLRGNVRKTWKYFNEILRDSLLIGCEEICGKVKRYFDEVLRHWLLIGCEKTWGKFRKNFDEISRHSVLIGCEETCWKLRNTLMKFWDTHFWLVAKKCAEKFKTLVFDWLRGNVRKTWKYFNEILRDSLLIGCEEICGKVKRYFDEVLRHWLLIGCEKTWGKFRKNFDEISRHSVLIGCEETCWKLRNTLMKFWDTHFWLVAKKCAEKFKTLGFDWLRGNVWIIEKYFNEILRDSLLIGCEEMCGKVERYFDEILRHWLLIGCDKTWGKFRKKLWWNFETLGFDWLRGNVLKT